MSKTGPDGKKISLFVDQQAFSASVHGGQACVDCHSDLKGQSLPHKPGLAPVQCSKCHHKGNTVGAPDDSPMVEYADSAHGMAAARGDKDAPKCRDCHGTHNIMSPSNPASSVYRTNIPNTCAKCHSDHDLAKRHDIKDGNPVKKYEQSVHGKALTKDKNLAAAVCTDCHGNHDIKQPTDPMSSVNKAHIPETCGKCHYDIAKDYGEGIHGKAIERGAMDAPVCTDCHGEHTIQKPSNKSSSVYPTHIRTTCSKCHENKRITRKYGIPGGRLKSYVNSYHGIANQYGETTVANCATCHEAHKILPSSDASSSVNKKNLPATCGKPGCHTGASANFAKGTVHLQPSRTKDATIYWVKLFYTLFVSGVMANFGLYILLDLRYRYKERRKDSEESH